jgi:hypothetical protein
LLIRLLRTGHLYLRQLRLALYRRHLRGRRHIYLWQLRLRLHKGRHAYNQADNNRNTAKASTSRNYSVAFWQKDSPESA